VETRLAKAFARGREVTAGSTLTSIQTVAGRDGPMQANSACSRSRRDVPRLNESHFEVVAVRERAKDQSQMPTARKGGEDLTIGRLMARPPEIRERLYLL